MDEDLKTAMKARQAERLAVIRMLKSAASERGGIVARPVRQSALGIMRKEMKKRPGSIAAFQRRHLSESVSFANDKTLSQAAPLFT
ncbi:MAG: GatB/YqeY domain-containing protein [Verrucomicrobiota bacterium]